MIEVYDMQRFLEAQRQVYADTLRTLRRGEMPCDMIDFFFPRLSDSVPRSNRFAISDLDEARAYLAFPVLGDRYRECAESLASRPDQRVCDVFGSAVGKVHASLTLFSEASNEVLFRTALAIHFDNRVDEATIVRLECELHFC